MDPLESALRLSEWKGRKYHRFKLEFPVTMKVQSGSEATEFEAVSKNISVGGLLVRSTFMIPCNTPVSFVLSVHGEQAVRPIHLIGEGEIVRAEGEVADATFALAVKCKAPITQLEIYLPA
jgi:PilZ domain